MTSSQLSIPFYKAAACGNDFLLIELDETLKDLPHLTRRICDRHTGIGADGVEWLSGTAEADIDAKLINADGSEAEISGNGTRCVAAYLCSQGGANGSGTEFRIRTGAGVKTCKLVSHSGNEFEFETGMGEPRVGEKRTIELSSGPITGLEVSTGNPHFVVFGKKFVDGWQRMAAELQSRPLFPQSINVEFVIVRDRSNLEVRFFERGAGETQSSGTGSCASAAAAVATGLAESVVHVHAPGGSQTVRWDGELFLRGTATLIGEGQFFL
jgi:diaminopimelate epimerase